MITRRSVKVAWVAGAWLMVACLAPQTARPDSWLPAREFEAASEGGKFTARVVPRSREHPPRVSVFPAGRADQPPLWTAALSNERAPLAARVSDDGRHVVTFDNWGGAGHGEDVLAFYDQTGQRKRYSLEQLLSAGGLDPDRAAYSQSTSSRWWRRGSIDLFDDGPDGRRCLCVWLGWAERWLAWDAASGEPVGPGAAPAERLNAAARQRVLRAVERGDDLVTAAAFLGWLGAREDRPVLEGLLRSPEFHRSLTTGGDDDRAYYSAFSEVRRAADAALALWNGKARGGGRRYVYLGSLHGSVHLPNLPGHPEANVRVYLVPEKVDGAGWAAAEPVHRLTMEVGSHLASPGLRPRFEGNTIPFRFEGVEPGRYWVKAVYDAAPPFCPDAKAVCPPQKDDYEGEDRRPAEVTAGQTAERPAVECTRRVGAAR